MQSNDTGIDHYIHTLLLQNRSGIVGDDAFSSQYCYSFRQHTIYEFC